MNVHILIAVIISVIVSFLSVQWVYFKVLKIAKEKKLVDNPDARKLSRRRCPGRSLKAVSRAGWRATQGIVVRRDEALFA